MKPTLFVLAAGMGSRYGGLKQLDGLYPNGETIMDYSVYDAIRAGFGKVVFVIRKDFEADFREKYCRNMKAWCLWKWYSRASTSFLKDIPVLPTAQSPGAPTMPC